MVNVHSITDRWLLTTALSVAVFGLWLHMLPPPPLRSVEISRIIKGCAGRLVISNRIMIVMVMWVRQTP